MSSIQTNELANEVTIDNRLTLDDIADHRAYERERPTFRAQMLALRRRRRVTLGPIIAVAFESRETIRYQIQEMARAEKLMTDDDIQAELDAYNPLIPTPSRLCATFVRARRCRAPRRRGWTGAPRGRSLRVPT
jgi:hypothetical protein